MWPLITVFPPRQREGSIHTEEIVYELNPLGEWPPPPATRVLMGL